MRLVPEAVPVETLSDRDVLGSYDESFDAARAHFVSLCRKPGIECEDHPIGDGGETLCIAHLGDRRARRKLVVLSGVHGVEGFAGSAAQIAFLQRHRDFRGEVHIIIAHIVNPHGMRLFRRTAPGNVDLNRNFVTDYAGLARVEENSLAAARLLSSPHLARLPEPLWLLWFAVRLPRVGGPRKLKEVFASGQYFDPLNLFFGGSERAAEVETLLRALSAALEGSAPRHVLFFDLHSGVGAFGRCTLMANGGDSRQAERIFGTPVDQGHDGDAAVYPVHGALVPGIKNALGIDAACAVTFEYGTGPALATFLRLRYENCARQHFADDPARARRARERMVRAFCPRSAAWRIGYVRTANRFLDRALDHLQAEPAHV